MKKKIHVTFLFLIFCWSANAQTETQKEYYDSGTIKTETQLLQESQPELKKDISQAENYNTNLLFLMEK